jgi:transposase
VLTYASEDKTPTFGTLMSCRQAEFELTNMAVLKGGMSRRKAAVHFAVGISTVIIGSGAKGGGHAHAEDDESQSPRPLKLTSERARTRITCSRS